MLLRAGFWDEVKRDDHLEKIWTWAKAFAELDKLSTERKGENGSQLDQFWSAKFLEDNDKGTTTVLGFAE